MRAVTSSQGNEFTRRFWAVDRDGASCVGRVGSNVHCPAQSHPSSRQTVPRPGGSGAEPTRPSPISEMTEIITAKAAAYHLESIIKGARERLVLVSPYLKVSDLYLQRLQETAARRVATIIVYGKGELNHLEQEKWRRFPEFKVLYLQNLHAKCFFNESEMVITSMNFYDVSEGNRELGVRLLATDPAYGAAVEEVNSIIRAARPPEWWQRKPQPWTRAVRKPGKAPDPAADPSRGFCVRCHRGIPLDPNRPFCIDCYTVWASYGNAEFKERWCHDCGAAEVTSMNRPLCRTCEKRGRRWTSWWF